MQIIYVIGGISPEYQGWLQIKKLATNALTTPNSDKLRAIVTKHVDRYMLPAGQKYHLYWAEISQESLNQVYKDLSHAKVPRYGHSAWFNTDVWTFRRILHTNAHRVTNYRRLKPIALAKYLYCKYQREIMIILKQPHNEKERRFKCDFFNVWRLAKLIRIRLSGSFRCFLHTYYCVIWLVPFPRVVVKCCESSVRYTLTIWIMI